MNTPSIPRTRIVFAGFHMPMLLVVALLAACGGSDDPTAPDLDPPDTGPSISDFVGSWTATSVVHTSKADPNTTFDIIAAGGEVRFTMLPNGDTRTWVEFGTFSDEWDAGMTLNGNTLTSTPAEASRTVQVWTVSLEAGVLTLTDTESEFDFTLEDAPPVGTTEVVTFVRN